MNMYKDIELDRKNEVDFELSRIERLIEEQENYEEAFFSMEPSSDEFEYLISEYESKIENNEISYPSDDFDENIKNPFESEDLLNQLRDEKLIEEREEYESIFFESFDFDSVNDDIIEFQIESFEQEMCFDENIDDYDFEYHEYEEKMYWDLYYLKKSQFDAPVCKCFDLDYMPHDDGLCDYLECYDYP